MTDLVLHQASESSPENVQFPRRWLGFVRRAIISVTPRFSARRMVKEYAEDLYGAAADKPASV